MNHTNVILCVCDSLLEGKVTESVRHNIFKNPNTGVRGLWGPGETSQWSCLSVTSGTGEQGFPAPVLPHSHAPIPLLTTSLFLLPFPFPLSPSFPYLLSLFLQSFYPFYFSFWCSFCLKDFIYLFLDSGERREKESERNINVWLPLTCPTLGNLASNPRYVPWLGFEPVTLWFAGWRSIHWATLVKVPLIFLGSAQLFPPLFSPFVSSLSFL